MIFGLAILNAYQLVAGLIDPVRRSLARAVQSEASLGLPRHGTKPTH
jgi:hypothetical protein